MLDVRRLRALRELADRGTIAAAADALRLTPSAVSQQLAALERDVGHALVEPNGRTVRLTPSASVLLTHADQLFAQLERLETDLDAVRDGATGTVRIGAFATAISGLVAPALVDLRARRPGLAVAVTEAEAPEALRGLARRELDVVVTMAAPAAPGPDDPRVARTELGPDVLDVALGHDHPLAGAPAVPLAALAGEDFILPPDGWSCDDAVRAGCASAGFTPRVAHRTGTWNAVVALVAAGAGVALVPRLAAVAPPPEAVVRPLAGAAPARHLFAATRRGAEEAPAVRTVVAALVAAAASVRGAAGA